MSCPTCDRTMQCVVHTVFWCPFCGTLKMQGAVPEFEAPKIVEQRKELVVAIGHAEDEMCRQTFPGTRRSDLDGAINRVRAAKKRVEWSSVKAPNNERKVTDADP